MNSSRRYRKIKKKQNTVLFYSDKSETPELHLGGVLQTDCHYYEEQVRADSRFDIRKARLFLWGTYSDFFRYRTEFEFQGTDQKKLTDAYGEALFHPGYLLRAGQFKEPFSLEWQTPDSALFFVERSMGYYLTPQRDVGLMLYGSFLNDGIHYAIGMFNGDGTDGSTRGNQKDDPEVAFRLVFAPCVKLPCSWLKSIHLGGSMTYARIDLTNVDLEVKSTGMVGTNRNVYVLNANTKFGVLQSVDKRHRQALEGAWTCGPIVLQGEYLRLKYTGLKPSGAPSQGADFSAWYGSILIFLTGESPEINQGALQPIKSRRNFDMGAGTWGGICLSVRREHFSGDEKWIMRDAFISVKKADSFSIGLNWFLNPLLGVVLDFTHTHLSDLIRVRVQSDGKVDYINQERVFTLRLYMGF